MDSHTPILTRGLGKKYRLGATFSSDTLRDALRGFAGRVLQPSRDRSSSRDFWALRDLDLAVAPGEVLGVIGRNGAGKSTLLKLLSRITEPTEGEIRMRGRVASLLEVGTGFHPELSGRENVYLNGAILGMHRREIASKFDAIVDFAGVDRFVDTPVKRYSSGMRVRLGFAVAAHLEPEILLIDEVLAVGDVGFQNKCVGKMNEVARSGRTIVFVSHNMASITALCHRCAYLKAGRLALLGDTDIVVRRYLGDFERTGTGIRDRADRAGSGAARLADLRFSDTVSGEPLQLLLSGQDVTVHVDYTSPGERPLANFNLGLAFYNSLGQFIMVLNSQMAQHAFPSVPPQGAVRVRVPRFPLMTGPFHVTATLSVNGELADQVEHAVTIQVESGDFFGTGRPNAQGRQGVYVPHVWSLCEPPAAAAVPPPSSP